MINFIKDDTKSDIYIGVNAGKRLLNAIHNARNVVRIISPYLDERSINQLIDITKKDVIVKLISTDEIREFNDRERMPLLREIIKQEKHLLEDEREARSKFFTFTLIFFGLLLIYLITAGVLFSVEITNLFFKTWYIIIGWVLILYFLYIKYKNWKIYSYSYYSLFEGFFIVSPIKMSKEEQKEYKNNLFLHSKVYIIDDEVAFLGSLNFTMNGIYNNFESCITIKDEITINEMIDFYEDLLVTKFLVKDINSYGRLLYKEPIN